MKQTNWRFVIAGAVAVVLAGVFFIFMMGLAPQSADPKALMETAGSTSGVVAAIGLVLVVLGFMGRKF